jgi:hypothetical protein
MMQNFTLKKFISFIVGFVILFLLYHAPEFFQRYYQEPLILLLELGMLVCVVVSYALIKIQKREGFAAYGLFQV